MKPEQPKFEHAKASADQFETDIDHNLREALLGKEVKVERSNGQIEDGWVVTVFEGKHEVIVTKGDQEKTVDLGKISELNPKLIRDLEPVSAE
jgi:hypothetical protein